MLFLRVLLAALLLWAWPTSRAAAFALDQHAVGAPLGMHMQYLEDANGSLTLQQLITAPDRMRASDKPIPNFGFTKSVVWFHLRLTSNDPTPTRWLLENQYSLMDDVRVYLVQGGRMVHKIESGRMLPFALREIQHRNNIYTLYLHSGEELDLYFRVRTTSSLQLPLVPWTPQAFFNQDHAEQYVLGIYYGILVSMLVFNLLIYVTMRHVSYLHYVHYIVFWILLQMALNGQAYEYLWPNWPHWGATAIPVFTCLALIGVINFSRSFLNLADEMPRLDRGMRYLAYLSALLCAASFVAPYGLMIKLTTPNSLLGSILVMVAGAACLAKHPRETHYRMLALAWTALLLGILVFCLKTAGLMPSTFLTQHALQLGSALEAVLLSFALAHRMRALKEENARIQSEATHQLEQRVQERTRELDDTLARLHEANAALQQLSLMDGLTGAKNRKFFDDTLSDEIKRTSRAKQPLSLLLIDIDHFKAVNDVHGHLAGDACLRMVARAIAACLRRPGDEAARYGGEEFGVILPQTDNVGAAHIAEQIREAIVDLDISFEGRRIGLTVSVGVCTVHAQPGDEPDLVVGRADTALYQAKHGGRNRVCMA